MEWEKVIGNLRKQANWHVEQANKEALIYTHEGLARNHRMKADIAVMFASALTEGLIR